MRVVMELLYKPDWQKTKERYLAWWAHESMDRCAISITAPKSDIRTELPPALPNRIEDRWLNYQYLHDINEYRMKRTFFGGEALPVWNAGYPGWDFIPSYLGATVKLMEETGWIDPLIDQGSLTDYDYCNFVISSDSPWWSIAKGICRYTVEASAGKSIPGIQAIGGCGDTLAALRGTNKLLLDVIDCPEYVREFDQYLMKQWIEVYETFYQMIYKGAEGSTCWLPLWAPGRFYAAENDFSYMISAKMFVDIFLPSIEMQTNYLDHTIYHVDGIGAFKHVDALCELPRLQTLQILPGAGKPGPIYYMEVLKKVQTARKNLHITIPSNEVEIALQQLSSRGLFIETQCETEEEARYILDMVPKWSKVRKN